MSAVTKPALLRALRITISLVVLSLLIGLGAAYGMTVPRFASVLAKVQFIPAAFSFSLLWIVVWLIATLIFGRIYCSTVCPMGTVQDIVARLRRLGRHRLSHDYHYSPALTPLRNIVLFLTVLSIFLGVSIIVSLVDPFSIFSRFMTYCVKPLWGESVNFFSSEPVVIASASLAGVAVSVVTMTVIAILAWRGGRTFCNTFCPVGTTLGFISGYSIFRIDINTDKCIQCRKCEHACKSSCIDLTSHVVDTSRCVVCFDCLQDCPNDAIHYTTDRHQLSIPMMKKIRNPLAGPAAGMTSGDVTTSQTSASDKILLDRRKFLAFGIIAAVSPAIEAVAAQEKKLRGGLLSGQHPSDPSIPVTPPGIASRQDFLDSCTGCGVCISHCPTGVLKPALNQYGLLRLFHPVKNYDLAYCDYLCTVCANLCPTGALRPLTPEEKVTTAVGLARVSYDLCLSCGRCARSCPAGAIEMVLYPIREEKKFPKINPAKCIGCGACQYVCPSRPAKAITVNGLS